MEVTNIKSTEYFTYKEIDNPNNDQFGFGRGAKQRKKITVMRSTYTQAMRTFDNLNKVFSNNQNDAAKFSHNRSILERSFSDRHDGFTGGSLRDLTSKPSMNEFNRIKSNLRRSNLYRKLQTVFHENNVRKRRMNPHDGEYDHDRRWDVNPFSRASKGLTPVRAIKIFANVCFAGGISSDVINRYGATLAAICNLIESAGITVEIVMQSGHDQTPRNDSYFLDEILIKKPGEYLPPTVLMSVFNSNFYRRVGFSRTVMNSEFQEKDSPGGLATPDTYESPIEFQKGELHIFSHSVLEEGRQDEFLKNLENALGLSESLKMKDVVKPKKKIKPLDQALAAMADYIPTDYKEHTMPSGEKIRIPKFNEETRAGGQFGRGGRRKDDGRPF